MPAPPAPPAMPSRYEPPGTTLRWLIRALALAALAGCTFLLYEELLGGAAGVPGCTAGAGCSVVLSSRWSTWWGLPVAAPGVLVYIIILGASLYLSPAGLHHARTEERAERASDAVRDRPTTAGVTFPPPAPTPQADQRCRRQRIAWMVLLAGTLLAAGAAVWFILVQALLLGSWCQYCDVIHGCGLVLSAVVWSRAPIGPRRLLADEPADPSMISPAAASTLAAAGLIAVAGFIGGQWAAPTAAPHVQRLGGSARAVRPIDTGPGPDRRVSLAGGRVRLSPHQYPTMGSADAPVLLVELFDYTCPHCRKLHGQLEKALKRYDGDLGVVVLPAPLDAQCNPLYKHTDPAHAHACELARLGLAVWKADPAAFESFNHWMFASDAPRSPKAARAKAAKLIGKDALTKALNDPWIKQQIQHDVELYAQGGGSLPQLFTPFAVVTGRPPTAGDLFSLLESETPLQSPEQEESSSSRRQSDGS